MQFSKFFNPKKILSISLISLSFFLFSNSHANQTIENIKFNNNKPINYKKIEKKSSVFLAPKHWQAGIDEKHVWVEPQDDSQNKFVFHARNGNDINNPNWAHKRTAGVRFFSW